MAHPIEPTPPFEGEEADEVMDELMGRTPPRERIKENREPLTAPAVED